MIHLRNFGKVIVVSTLLMGSGCASFQPYIVPNSKTRSSACREGSITDSELYLCASLASVRAKRSQLAITQSVFATSLFPIAGIVGYRSGRSLNSAATVGWASVGLTGYALGQYLVQDARFIIYDKGESALGCVLGIHETWKSKLTASPVYAKVLGTHSAFSHALEGARAELKAQTHVSQMRVIEARAIANFESALRYAATADEGNLRQATERVVGEINTAMTTNGLLPLTSLAPQASSLQSHLAITSPTQGVSSESSTKGLSIRGNQDPPKDQDPPSLSALRSAAEDLESATSAWLLTSPSVPPTPLEYAKCSVGAITVQPAPPEQPLMLGPNNSMDSESAEIATGEQLVIPLFGGRQPITPAVLDPSDASPTVVIQQQGGAQMLVLKASEKTAPGRYTVLVTDSSGLWVRQLSIFVKAKQQ